MKIVKSAAAGTLESSDAMVTVEPCAGGREIEIESVVLAEYGEQIHCVAEEVLDEYGVDNVSIRIVDKGAMDCVLSARLETALRRAGEVQA